MVLNNIQVLGLENAVRGQKFPMSVDISQLNGEIKPITKQLGQVAPGTGHDQFLTGIIVQFDLTFSNKAWVEAERYHWLDFISSQSTMHRISKMGIEQCCNEYVDKRNIAICEELQEKYLETKDPEDYLRLLYNIPAGFQLTAAMTTNFRQLKTIYYQRRNHRLPEWREFCKQLEEIPHFKELCLKDEIN